MILYHGSIIEIKNPQILTQEKGRDFGFGFYTTSIKEQAERWAIRKTRISSRFSKEQKNAVVNIYEFDETILNQTNYKSFQEPNLEWLEFVIQCRSNLSFRHDYDIVSGKIVDGSNTVKLGLFFKVAFSCRNIGFAISYNPVFYTVNAENPEDVNHKVQTAISISF